MNYLRIDKKILLRKFSAQNFRLRSEHFLWDFGNFSLKFLKVIKHLDLDIILRMLIPWYCHGSAWHGTTKFFAFLLKKFAFLYTKLKVVQSS